MDEEQIRSMNDAERTRQGISWVNSVSGGLTVCQMRECWAGVFVDDSHDDLLGGYCPNCLDRFPKFKFLNHFL